MGFFSSTVLAIRSHVHLGVEVGSFVLPDHGPGLVPSVPSRFGGNLGITVGNHGPAGQDMKSHFHFMLKPAGRPCFGAFQSAPPRFGIYLGKIP